MRMPGLGHHYGLILRFSNSSSSRSLDPVASDKHSLQFVLYTGSFFLDRPAHHNLKNRVLSDPILKLCVRMPGLEPGTSSLSVTHSNQLSYTRICNCGCAIAQVPGTESLLGQRVWETICPLVR